MLRFLHFKKEMIGKTHVHQHTLDCLLVMVLPSVIGMYHI